MDTTDTRRQAALLARLAAERANLLTQLTGVDETTLTRGEVMPGWSPAMLLAHVGYWDAFHADRLAKLSDGRRAELTSLSAEEMHHRNEDFRIRIAGVTFTEALALCQKERRGYLAALNHTADELLLRRTRLGKGWRVTPITWVRRRYRHDAGHAADLAHWRATLASDRRYDGYAHHSLLRPLLGLARQEFLSLASLVTPSERTTRLLNGSRTLQQMIGILTGFDETNLLALNGLRREASSLIKTESAEVKSYETQLIARFAEKSWTEVWEQFQLTRRALLRLCESLPDEAMNSVVLIRDHMAATPTQILLEQVRREQTYADAVREALNLPRLPLRLRRSPTERSDG